MMSYFNQVVLWGVFFIPGVLVHGVSVSFRADDVVPLGQVASVRQDMEPVRHTISGTDVTADNLLAPVPAHIDPPTTLQTTVDNNKVSNEQTATVEEGREASSKSNAQKVDNVDLTTYEDYTKQENTIQKIAHTAALKQTDEELKVATLEGMAEQQPRMNDALARKNLANVKTDQDKKLLIGVTKAARSFTTGRKIEAAIMGNDLLPSVNVAGEQQNGASGATDPAAEQQIEELKDERWKLQQQADQRKMVEAYNENVIAHANLKRKATELQESISRDGLTEKLGLQSEQEKDQGLLMESVSTRMEEGA